MSTFSLAWFAVIGVTIPAFWLTPPKWRLQALALATLILLAAIDPMSALMLALITSTTWFYTRGSGNVTGPRSALALGIPIAMLLFFKTISASNGDNVVQATIVPLGLAFYTLRAGHFAIERYLGRIGETDFLSFARYLLFLPTILIGPIHRYPDFERDVRRNRWEPASISLGLERMLYGAFKIAVLGNFLTWRIFGNFIADNFDSDTPLKLYLTMIMIGSNLYLQFSGASDVAIGFARCLGFRVMENFNWPFLATSIPDFWRRWHISLTSLAREYVYAGIGAISRDARLAALSTMLAIGLWHEASLRYVLWGVYHGIGIATWQSLERRMPEIWRQHLLYKFIGWFVTIHFVLFGFYFVRLPDPVGAFFDMVLK